MHRTRSCNVEQVLHSRVLVDAQDSVCAYVHIYACMRAGSSLARSLFLPPSFSLSLSLSLWASRGSLYGCTVRVWRVRASMRFSNESFTLRADHSDEACSSSGGEGACSDPEYVAPYGSASIIDA